jgi:hypothetical protein
MKQSLPLANDNAKSRALYMGKDYKGDRQRLLTFVPIARKLIAKYLKEPHKHPPNDTDYAFLEYQLCTLLEIEGFRRYKVNSIATVLGCNQIMLYNDPDLPF